jgi:hypothetical protein
VTGSLTQAEKLARSEAVREAWRAKAETEQVIADQRKARRRKHHSFRYYDYLMRQPPGSL